MDGARFEARVTGMHCAGCVASIEKAVTGLPGGRERGSQPADRGPLGAARRRPRSADSGAHGGHCRGRGSPPAPIKLEPPLEAGDELPEAAGGVTPHQLGRAGSGFVPVAAALGLAGTASMAVSMSGFGTSTAAGRYDRSSLLATPVCRVLRLEPSWSRRSVFRSGTGHSAWTA